MTDTKALRQKIKNSGLKYKYIAEQLSLSPYCLQLKIDNVFEFKVSEVNKLSSILSLTATEKDSIFFAH